MRRRLRLPLFVLGWAGSAGASEPTPIRIEFEAPAACSTPEDFFRAVQGRTDRVRPAGPHEPAFYVRVKLTRAGPNVRGELRVVHDQGQTSPRAVEGASCDVVVDALSLTAALAIDTVVAEGAQAAHAAPASDGAVRSAGGASGSGGAASEGARRAGQGEGGDPRDGDDDPDDAGEDSDADEGDDEFRLARARGAAAARGALGVRLVLTQVVDPFVNVGAGLAARMTLNHGETFAPTLGLAFLHARNGLFESNPSAAVTFSAVELSACPLRLSLGLYAGLSPCALGTGGVLEASGQGVPDSRSATRSFWAAGGSLRADALLGAHLALEVEAGLSAVLVDRSFVVEPDGRRVGATPSTSVSGNIGIYYVF